MSTTAESLQARLLIVDDKTANLDLLRDMLAPLGHQIFFATSGARALRIASSVRPDLVLLDVMMPDMDGFETCRRLKAEEALAEIPVIFVTARHEVDERVKGLELGADDYVIKPFAFSELLARMQAVLRRRNALPAIEVGDLRLDLASRQVERGGQKVEVTARDETDAVFSGEFEFRGILDEHDALVSGDFLEHGVEESGLAGGGAARDEDGAALGDGFAQERDRLGLRIGHGR